MLPNTELNRLKSSQLELVELNCGTAQATLTLQGAHLVSYRNQNVEHLWLSPKSLFEPGKPIRGGVPICWPWFAKHPTDDSQPMHGFARTSVWQLTSKEEHPERSTLGLRLASSDPDYPLQADLLVELTPTELSLSLTTINLGDTDYSLTEALHTYLPVSDLENAALHGLQNTHYADKLQNFAQQRETRKAVYLKEPTDRVYFDTRESLTLIDAGWGRTTNIRKQGSGATVVWNAGEIIAAGMSDLGVENYRGYICVEAANALEAAVSLAPGKSHTLRQQLSSS